MISEFEWLASWYQSQCDGDWEHQYGIRIETLDNPGWSVEIDLAHTSLEGLIVQRQIQGDPSEAGNWIAYETKDNVFRGSCDPASLPNLLRIIRKQLGAIS